MCNVKELSQLMAGEAIKNYRKHNHLSQEKMADLLEVSQKAISRYENNKSTPEPAVQELIDIYMPWLKNNGNPLEGIFDYMRVRFDDLTPEQVMTDIVNIRPEWWSDEQHGILRYDAYMAYGDIKILYDNTDKGKGVLLEMTGQACRQIEDVFTMKKLSWLAFFGTVLENNGHFKRIDIAINDYYEMLDINELAMKAFRHEFITKFKKYRVEFGGSYSLDEVGDYDGDSTGTTIYFGAPQSMMNIVFYQKNFEQEQKVGVDREEVAIKNRYEIRFADDYADDVAEQFFNEADITEIAMGLFYRYICFVDKPREKDIPISEWPVSADWAQFMDDVNEVKLTMKPKKLSFDKSIEALAKQYSSVIAMGRQYDMDTGSDVLKKIIEQAEMSDRHKKLLGAKEADFHEVFGDKDWGMNGDE